MRTPRLIQVAAATSALPASAFAQALVHADADSYWVVPVGLGLMLLIAVPLWLVYPKIFQARSARWNRSAWQRFKGRVAFTITGTLVAILFGIPIMRAVVDAVMH